MYVSVVICTHNLANYQNLVEAVESIQEQTYRDKEIIVVVDGNYELYEKFSSEYRGKGIVKTILLKENMGISEARNAGIRAAIGDTIAFTDDDAIAEREWVKTLVTTYESFDAIAVGGKVLPVWIGSKPDYLPEELYWLIGVTHQGFAQERILEVRNTFGPNMSFKREVFEKIGLFNKNLGFAKRNTVFIQAEETDLALRMKQAFGMGVTYNPQAVVFHKVSPAKLKVSILLRRAFYQGYSKALVQKYVISAGSMEVETNYLKTLLLHNIPQRAKRVCRLTELKKSLILITSIIIVGLGFAYGRMKTKIHTDTK